MWRDWSLVMGLLLLPATMHAANRIVDQQKKCNRIPSITESLKKIEISNLPPSHVPLSPCCSTPSSQSSDGKNNYSNLYDPGLYAPDLYGYTSLMYAAMRGCAGEAIAILSSNSSGIDCVDDDGNTALMLAAQNGKLAVVKEILKFGPRVDIKDETGSDIFNCVAGDGGVFRLF